MDQNEKNDMVMAEENPLNGGGEGTANEKRDAPVVRNPFTRGANEEMRQNGLEWKEFLDRVQMDSLEKVEDSLNENNVKMEEYRAMLELLKEIEEVDNLPDLLEKINNERKNFAMERSGWQKMGEEMNELTGVMQLRDDERMVDKWKALNVEFQDLSSKLEALQVQVGDGSPLGEAMARVALLEAQNSQLIKERSAMKERIRADKNLEIVKIDEERMGQHVPHLSESRREIESMRVQRLRLQQMRTMRGSGAVSMPPPHSMDARSMREPVFSMQRTAAEQFADYRNGEYGHTGGGDTGDQEAQYANYPNQNALGTGFTQEFAGIGSNGGVRGEQIMCRPIGMLGNALPHLSTYSGKKEDWEDFETGFMIRYGAMNPAVAMSLLKDCLNGDAKDALRAVPEDLKIKGVQNVLRWLRRRLSNETPFEIIEVEKKLRNQEVNGKSVGKICEELEEWTMKLNPEVDKREAARRRQLLILFEGKYTDHMRLQTLFGEGASYSQMKIALVELEYLEKTVRESDDVTCHNCGGYGHRKYQCPSEVGQGGVEIISRDSDL